MTITRTTRRARRAGRTLLAAAAVASVVATTPAPAAAAPHQVDDLGALVSELVGEAAAAPAEATPSAEATVARAAASLLDEDAGAAGTVRAAASCAGSVEHDGADAPHLDGEVYLLDYDCADRGYVAAVGTYDVWAQSELDSYLVLIDTDGNTGNGCNRGDHAVIGYWEPGYGLEARVLRTPSCNSDTWVDRGAAYIDRAGSVDFVGIAFDAAQIGSPTSSIRWSQTITGVYNPGTDLLPDQGTKTTALPGGTPTAPPPAAQTVFGYGTPFHGSTGAARLNAPLVGMASTTNGAGYWLLGGDGGIFSYGNARFHGSTGAMRLNKPVVGMAAPASGKGYWLVASDGGIFSFGVPFHGSTGAMRLNKPVVGMAATTSGKGYWLVASDGGVFAYGDARFSGSTGAIALNQPVVGMAADPDGVGYWFVAADGGIFAFDAPFHGSAAGRLAPGDRVVSMAANPTGGYWVTSAKGAVHAFGGAPAHGGATATGREISAMAAHPTNGGYWLLAAR